MKSNNKLSKVLTHSNLNIAASFTDKSSVADINKAFAEGLDIAEIRLDLFSDLNRDNILKVSKNFSEHPTILTIRSNNEGGKWDKADAQRLELYKLLIGRVDAIDIELISEDIVDEVVKLANENNINVIISHHNFEKTPDTNFLENIIDKAINKGADIVKIATFVKDENDYLTLQNLLADKDENLVIIGMGDKGKKSRIEFPKLGSKFTFCSVEQSTAPGQISLHEMVSNLKG